MKKLGHDGSLNKYPVYIQYAMAETYLLFFTSGCVCGNPLIGQLRRHHEALLLFLALLLAAPGACNRYRLSLTLHSLHLRTFFCHNSSCDLDAEHGLKTRSQVVDFTYWWCFFYFSLLSYAAVVLVPVTFFLPQQ